jgi:GMP synthase-like glutamine amidotransferase
MEIHDKYVLLWGGVDVNPTYYGESPLPQTQRSNIRRDVEEFLEVDKAFENKKPVIGVCRGAQLLCVANGGKLFQHTEQHGGGHALVTKEGALILQAAAGHHQVMNLEGTEHEVLAWAPFKTIVYNQEGRHILERAPEVVYFPKTNSLACQPHPEWETPKQEFRKYIDKIVFDRFDLIDIFSH